MVGGIRALRHVEGKWIVLCGDGLMIVLNYATLPPRRRTRRRFVVAVIIGMGTGIFAGKFAYEPMLRAIVGGMQLYVVSVNQVFSPWLWFMAFAGISGAIIGCASVVSAGQRKMWFGWPILFASAYFFAAFVGLIGTRAWWQSQTKMLAMFAQVAWTRSPNVSANLQVGVVAQLKDVPTLVTPICGCAGVLLVLGALLWLRLVGIWTQPTVPD
jgi:hypothetical protein